MLGIIRAGEFHGIVGTESTAICDGQTICVGDRVRVAAGRNWRECDGIVLIIKDTIAVMGLAGRSVDQLQIKSILISHKDIKSGDTLDDIGNITVVDLIGFKE